MLLTIIYGIAIIFTLTADWPTDGGSDLAHGHMRKLYREVEKKQKPLRNNLHSTYTKRETAAASPVPPPAPRSLPRCPPLTTLPPHQRQKNVRQVMTLTGIGDLILHKGALLIQPQQLFITAPWQKDIPPAALLVSGGSLDVRGGGAKISSTRANAPGLEVSVGLPDAFGGSGGPSEEGFHSQGGDASFSYSGVALSVNVKETAEHGTRSPDRFRLLELSVGGGEEDEGIAGGDAKVILSVRGDGRMLMAGGGGIVLGEGNLEVSQGDATFQVSARGGGMQAFQINVADLPNETELMSG